jgi:hypothetical protein
MDILYREIAKDGRLDSNCLQTLLSTMDYEEETDISMYDSSPIKDTKCTNQPLRRVRKRLFKNRNESKLVVNLNSLTFCLDGIDSYDLEQGCKESRSSKHVPHALQQPEKVEQRNTRERNRVHTVNSEFRRLRHLLPIYNRGKRISKENILKYAIRYIEGLQLMIKEHDQYNKSKISSDQPKTTNNNTELTIRTENGSNFEHSNMESMEEDDSLYIGQRDFDEEQADEIEKIDQYCSEEKYHYDGIDVYTSDGSKYCDKYIDNCSNMEVDSSDKLMEDSECLLDLEELCSLSW